MGITDLMQSWQFLNSFHFFVTALLFSATFRKKIERLARDILIDPIRIVQGDIGEVSSVSSRVCVCVSV